MGPTGAVRPRDNLRPGASGKRQRAEQESEWGLAPGNVDMGRAGGSLPGEGKTKLSWEL